MNTGESVSADSEPASLSTVPDLDPAVIEELLLRSVENTDRLGRCFIPLRLPEGSPTLGRHTVSLNDVQATYVNAPMLRSDRRNLIWNNFLALVARVRRTVPVNAVMIGGSFTTWKQTPSDIDVVFVLDKRQTARLSDPRDIKFLTALSSGTSARIRGWGIDSYTLDWEAIPRTTKENPLHFGYLVSRGYWDDWLQRSHSKTEEPNTGHAVPRRGYLEVIVDGYAADV